MDVSPPSWTAFMILCLTSTMHQNWCFLEVDCQGKLTVDPGPLVEWGSSLSVLCQINECRASPQIPFSIKLNQLPLHPVEQNCSTARFHISNMTEFNSTLVCVLGDQVVCGLDLRSGFHPAKVTQFNCFTPIKSATINCSWMTGREPFLSTEYSVMFSSVNGSKSFTCQHPGCSSITIPRASFSERAKYEVHVIAQNALGVSTSDLFTFSVRDTVIPDAPSITGVNFTHINGSCFLMNWSSSDSSKLVCHRIQLGRELIWEGDAPQRNGSAGCALIEGLKPVTTYQIEVRVCTPVPKPKCSLWSEPVVAVTPGIAPAHKPDAWRIVGHKEEYGVQNVTVLWKPMESQDFRPLHYEVSYRQRGQRSQVPCPLNVSEVHLQLPAQVKELTLTLVTSAGRSPPASLSLTHTNIPAPVVRVSSPKEDGLFLSWLWRMKPAVTGFLLGYVIQWQCKASQVQWTRLSRDYNSTYIRGLKPGWRYEVLLHAESTRGLSEPALVEVYSEERKPLSGPKAFILNSDLKHILIRWEEPTLEHQGGFLTYYTIYIRKHGTGNFKPMFQVEASSKKEKLLETLDTGFDLCISAWNSAGEGPTGAPVTYLQKSSLKDGVFVGIWVVAAVPLVLVANLMCLKCARRRIRAACLMVGPGWLFEKFPKVGNSNAIKLLKDEGCGSDSLWMSVCSDSDPPLSPVEDIPEPITVPIFLFTSIHGREKSQDVCVAKPEIVDPYKPQWADSCEVSAALLPEPPEGEPEEEGTEEGCPIWQCLPQPSCGTDIGLGDVTLGGFKRLGVTGNLLCSPLLVLKETEWHMNENGGMGELDGFSLALLTDGQTALPNKLLSTLKVEVLESLQINPYSPQGCWFNVAQNT